MNWIFNPVADVREQPEGLVNGRYSTTKKPRLSGAFLFSLIVLTIRYSLVVIHYSEDIRNNVETMPR